jgi:hypothetical protein
MTFRQAQILAVSGLFSFAFAACCDLEIASESPLPDGKVGESYSFEFSADCDDDEWELVSGTLPPGLSLARGGELTGVPSLAGNFTLTVGVGGEGESSNFQSKGFSLLVVEPVGTLAITVATTGSSSDPDGFTVQVGEELYAIGVNETLQVPEIPVGRVTVTLAGLAPGCSVQGNNPQVVTIAEGQTATATFEVVCNTP